MKDNFIHVCFVIDESGSMAGTESDVIGGFKKVVDEQKELSAGTCAVSYFKFATYVKKVYLGKDVHEVEYLDGKYYPNGLTALFYGVGTAIDEVGKWLDQMPEEEKPEKNLIVIMTDGGENNSVDYTADKVREMIKHQEEKYNWSFIYMGSYLTDAHDANAMGIKTRSYSSKLDYDGNYATINLALSSYRCAEGSFESKMNILNETLEASAKETTEKYAKDNGLNAADLL